MDWRDPPEATQLHWLAHVCVEIRERKGLRTETVAHYAAVSNGTVRNFEAAKTAPHDLEHMVATYAALDGKDPRELFEEAQRLWKKEGEPPKRPALAPARPLEDAVPPAPEELLGQKQPSASPKKQRRGHRAS